MNTTHIRSLDLNLLRIFVALLEEGSVTRAGARLGLTQSAVSHALNRLRYGLQDDLFVRGPSGMQPTARAREIAPRVRQGLAQLQAALAPADFTPTVTDRRFVVSAGPYPSSVLLPGGFFLGGVSFYGGDPGLGALLIPVGAVFLLTGVVSTARALTTASR